MPHSSRTVSQKVIGATSNTYKFNTSLEQGEAKTGSQEAGTGKLIQLLEHHLIPKCIIK